jgi:hypothetical protein
MSETAVKLRPAGPAGTEIEDDGAGRAQAPGGAAGGRKCGPAPRLKYDPEERYAIPDEGDDPMEWYRRFAACFCSDDGHVGLYFLRALQQTLAAPENLEPGAANALLAACAALEPENELDGLMAVHLAALHAVAMANFSVAALLSERAACAARDARGALDPVPARTLAAVRCVRAFALNREIFERMRAARRKGGK